MPQTGRAPDELPEEKSLPPLLFPKEGILYTKDNPQGKSSSTPGGVFFEDFDHPLEEVISQLFMACQFKDVSVLLDNNYFVHSVFDGVTFKYTGKQKRFVDWNNTYNNCTVELPDDVPLPNHEGIFGQCRQVRTKNVSLDEDTVGKPMQWHKDGSRWGLEFH